MSNLKNTPNYIKLIWPYIADIVHFEELSPEAVQKISKAMILFASDCLLNVNLQKQILEIQFPSTEK